MPTSLSSSRRPRCYYYFFSTMAALLPTILSDEEDENVIDTKKLGKKKVKKYDKVQIESDDEQSKASSGDEMDGDFEFGGMLGEDGFDALSSLRTGFQPQTSWSYKSALSLLSKNDSMGVEVERTSVASIIAAARSNLKRDGKQSRESEKGEEIEEKSDKMEESESSDEESESKSSESDNSSSDDEVDDANHATSMDADKLTIRDGPKGKKKGTKVDLHKTKIGEELSDESTNKEESDNDQSDADEEDELERAKADAFFDSSHTTDQNESIDTFTQLGLSRPLLRGVASMGFVSPTPIQSSVLPVAMAGRDVCASAVTGSGKTAAFLLPVLERILQRGGGRSTLGLNAKKKASALAATRCLILTPTRELAAQCVSMMTAIAKFTDLRCALIVGGAKNVMSQASELRTRPDVIVATPGRLIDHITNSQGVDLDDLEFLVLDEADRLLDLGFQDEVHEIVKSCPIERQTLLFSATMSTKVDELIKLSLKRPVRIQATDKSNTALSSAGVEVAPRLEQEFIRIRPGNEGVNREGMLLALLTRTFKSRVIVFFETKSLAHRLMIICGLCGIKCSELHGNLTQVQRLEALEAFREGSVDVLLATDLAARGLDIPGVEAVVNFEMPSQVDTYVHRIGRTARAGRGGKSCTLIGEGRRYLMKAVIKDAEEKSLRSASSGKADCNDQAGVIRSRTIPPPVIAHFVAKINSLEQHIKDVLDAEAVSKMDRIAEMEAMRAKNIIEHNAEIMQRPKKEWFTSNQQRMSAKEAAAEKKRMIEEKAFTGTHRMSRKKRRAQEAHAAMEEAREEARQKAEESGKKSKKALSDGAIRGSAKAAKRKELEHERELAQRSVHDDDMRRERKLKQKRQKASSDALGDGGLFSEEKIAHAKKPKKGDSDAPKSSYTFKEYDPNKKKSKKKATHHGFKSKSKYKRR